MKKNGESPPTLRQKRAKPQGSAQTYRKENHGRILCVKRYMEQWILWIVVDVVTVFMWIAAFFNGGESVATLLMWSIYLLNAIFMFIKWYKESKTIVSE